MADARNFGGVLARLRRERGYPTARSFYKGRDGRKSFGLNYRNYLNLENGRSLPKVKRLEAILLALGFAGHENGARELIDAYFEALGLARLARFWSASQAPLSDPPEPNLGELAARQAVQKMAVQLSSEQWKLRASDYEAHLCFVFLFNTPNGLGLAELARMTGFKPSAVERAVRALKSAGLVTVSRGRARSAFGDSYIQPPPKTPEMAGVWAALNGYYPRVAHLGRPLHTSTIFARLRERNLKYFERHLDQLLDLAALYSSPETTEDSGVYFFWGRVFKLFPR